MVNFLLKKRRKSINNTEDNIFRSISNKRDSECNFLTSLCFQKDCFYDKDGKKNIVKHCYDTNVLEWESIVYLYLVDKRMAPLMTLDGNNLCYETNDKISLYEYIKSSGDNVNAKFPKPNIKFILNELFGFICKFREYNFLHGNLHIHNIFINPYTFMKRERFYIIDYSNSFLRDENKKSEPKHQRSSFLGESDRKIASIFFEYWDFFTVYISLKLLLKNNIKNISYLDNLIQSYIKPHILSKFIEEYDKHNDSNIVTYHLNTPTFIDT